MGIFDLVRARQRSLPANATQTPPPHEPEMLYIGCIDARLDPIDDIGIPKGKALIFRNIAALVRACPVESAAQETLDKKAVLAAGEIPENVSIGAALEFFIKHLPAPKDGVKHIVVSGHTNCGGIDACLNDKCAGDTYLPRYFTALEGVRDAVLKNPQLKTRDEQLHALEEASVRQSIENLMSYEVVRKAVEEGRVVLHGWVINTANHHISEMNQATGIFEELAGRSTGASR